MIETLTHGRKLTNDFVLKLTSDGSENTKKEFRRVRLSQIAGVIHKDISAESGVNRFEVELADDSYDSLMNLAKKYFVQSSVEAKIRLSYLDEDNDWVVLGSTEELQDSIMSVLEQSDSLHHVQIRVKVSTKTEMLEHTVSSVCSHRAAHVEPECSKAMDAGCVQTISMRGRNWKLAACCLGAFSFVLLEVALSQHVAHFLQQKKQNCTTLFAPSSCATSSSGGVSCSGPPTLQEVCVLDTVQSSNHAPLQSEPSTTASSPNSTSRTVPAASLDSILMAAKSAPASSTSNAIKSPNKDPLQRFSNARPTPSPPGSSVTTGGAEPKRTVPKPDDTTTTTSSQNSTTSKPKRAGRKNGDLQILKGMLSGILQGEGPSSPFLKAYEWVQDDPYWKRYSKERLRQRLGLVAFYYATNGNETWKRSDHWLSHQVHECRWWPGGFTTSICGEGKTDRRGKKWQYERLWLPNNGLEGTLPPKLFQLLPSLRHIRLDRNIWMSGSLPSELGLLTQVQQVWLQHNMFTGSVPSEFGQLAALEKLCLAENDLQGSLDPKLFTSLSNLRNLWLDHNRLTGPIPTELSAVPLVKLSLSHNHFAGGGIAAAMLGSLTHLEHLVAPINLPSSSSLVIPSEVGLLTNLRHLDMFVSSSKWWSLSSHKWGRSEVATLHNLDTLRVGTEASDDELIDLLTMVT